MRSSLLVFGLALVMGAAACGGDPAAATPEDPSAAGESAVDVRRARTLAHDAEKALKAEEFAKARTLLRQADRFADSIVREEMRVVAERVDKAEAKLLVTDVIAAAKEAKCAEALDTAAELTELPGKGPFFVAFVQELTSEGNVACLIGMLEGDASLRDVRLIVTTKNAKRALGTKALKEVRAKLTEVVVAKLTEKVDEPFQAKKWKEVVAKLDEAVVAGEAGQTDVKPVLDKVAAAIRVEAEQLIAEAMEQPTSAAAATATLDTLFTVVWAPDGDSDAPKASQPKAMKLPPVPADLKVKRDGLKFAAVCGSVRCTAAPPTKVWIYGNVDLTPTMDPKGKAKGKLKHGTKVWQIGTAAGLALVARKKPGKLGGIGTLAKPAAGWVPASGVRKSNTSKSLPPGDAMVGARVWGPLRKNEPHYLVGTVVSVKGGQIKVRRMSDHQEVTVARGQLRFGAAKKGLKVLAMCGGGFKLKPAVVRSVKDTKFAAQGDPVVKVECLDDAGKPTGEKRDEQMGSLRVKPSDLPPAQ